MRKTQIGAALVTAILITASCGENQSPVAPTPVPEPEPTEPVVSQTLEIVGIPQSALPAGEVILLTAQIRRSDGGTETLHSYPTWTSSNPKVARIELHACEDVPELVRCTSLVALTVGRTEITATFEELYATANVEIAPAQPNETLWRELAFNSFECPPTDAMSTPLEERTLRRIASHITELRDRKPHTERKSNREPPRGPGSGSRADHRKTVPGNDRGRQRRESRELDHDRGCNAGEPRNRRLMQKRVDTRRRRSAAATLGTIYGCIMLGMHRDETSSTETILHELGHAMGFYHTSDQRTVMFRASGHRSQTFTAQEQYHTQLAYRHPRGTTYRAIKLSTFGPQRHLRPRQVDPRPIFIVD